MGGLVCVALRQNGETTAKVMSTFQADSLFWKRGFFSNPKLPSKLAAKPFAPEDYGIIAIDADNRWVGSLQGYSTLATMSPLTIQQELNLATAVATAMAGKTLVLKTFCRPMEGGQSFHHPTPFTVPSGQIGALELRQALDQATDQARRELEAQRLVDLDTWKQVSQQLPAGWTIDHFDELQDAGWMALCSKLVDLNWLPSEEELQQWEAHLAYKEKYSGANVSIAGCKPLRAHYLEQHLSGSLGEPGIDRKKSGPRM